MYGPNEGGFHHVCRISDGYAAEVDMLRSSGITLVGEGKFGDMNFCFADTQATLGCMLELVPNIPLTQHLHQIVRDAAWIGRRAARIIEGEGCD